MQSEAKWIAVATGSVALGLFAGLDTVRAIDPLPVFIPAKPMAPYEAPATVPADVNAYPMAVVLPPYELPPEFRDPPDENARRWREPVAEAEADEYAAADVEYTRLEDEDVSSEPL